MPLLRNHLVLLVLSALIAGTCAAQSQPLKFDEPVWNFGRIAEDGGKVSHTYVFTNAGAKPVVIHEVVSTCACTVGAFSREPVMPGQKGSVTVTFDPLGLTPTITRTLKVAYEGGNKFCTLTLQGQIELRESVELDYPYPLAGGLYTSQTFISFRQRQHGAPVDTVALRLFNNTSRRITPGYTLTQKSGCVRILMPAAVEPGKSAEVRMILSPPSYFYGHFNDLLYITAGQAKGSPVRLTGIVVDNTKGVNMGLAPKCTLSPAYFALGQRAAGTVKCSAKLTNTGAAPLIVRKIEDAPHVKCALKTPPTLQPGDSVTLDFTLTLAAGTSVDEKIYLITNDPRTPALPIGFQAMATR